MKLKLTDSLKNRLRQTFTSLLFDLIDGELQTADQTAELLEALAEEIRIQNAKQNP